MSSDQLPPPITRAARRSRKPGQDETLHPEATIDEANKAVVDPAPVEYDDVVVYLSGAGAACWVFADSLDGAKALFNEYAQVDGEPVEMEGPVAGDRVLRAHVDGKSRVLLLSPLSEIVRKVRA